MDDFTQDVGITAWGHIINICGKFVYAMSVKSESVVLIGPVCQDMGHCTQTVLAPTLRLCKWTEYLTRCGNKLVRNKLFFLELSTFGANGGWVIMDQWRASKNLQQRKHHHQQFPNNGHLLPPPYPHLGIFVRLPIIWPLNWIKQRNNALCVKPLRIWEIKKWVPWPPFSAIEIISDRNIWVNIFCQFHFLSNIWVRVETPSQQYKNQFEFWQPCWRMW